MTSLDLILFDLIMPKLTTPPDAGGRMGVVLTAVGGEVRYRA